MPTPLDYPAFKRFVIANALTSGVFPLSEMTVMWLFLQGLHNLFLFSFVASSRPVTRIFASPIGGYIGDRFDRARTYTLTRLATPVTILGIMYCLLTHQYLLGIVLVYARATISQLNSVVATTALYTLVPKELMVKAMAVNRFMKEPATVIGTLSWPFLLGLLGAKVLLISSSVLIITTLLVYKLKVSPGRKDVGFLTGFRLVKEKEEVRGAVVGIVFDQAGGAIVLNYLPYIIQLYGGGEHTLQHCTGSILRCLPLGLVLEHQVQERCRDSCTQPCPQDLGVHFPPSSEPLGPSLRCLGVALG